MVTMQQLPHRSSMWLFRKDFTSIPALRRHPFRHLEKRSTYLSKGAVGVRGMRLIPTSSRTAIVSRCFCIARLLSFYLGARISRKELWFAVSEWNPHFLPLLAASASLSSSVFQRFANDTETTSERCRKTYIGNPRPVGQNEKFWFNITFSYKTIQPI